MKLFKPLFIAAFSAFAISSASAEDYNRIGISYNNNHFGVNDWLKDGAFYGLFDGISLNGVGINYIHGFSLSQSTPIFIETGINANFGVGSTDTKILSGGLFDVSSVKFEVKAQNVNLQVPVNFVYRIAASEDVTIAPYAGLNFKFNIVTKLKGKLSAYGESVEGDWFSLFSKDDMEEAFGDDGTGNRFQMGWHIGVGVQYKPLYLGVSYGTDFIAAYSQKFNGKSAKVNTRNLTVNVGYTF